MPQNIPEMDAFVLKEGIKYLNEVSRRQLHGESRHVVGWSLAENAGRVEGNIAGNRTSGFRVICDCNGQSNWSRFDHKKWS
jgi:hypothetical protein